MLTRPKLIVPDQKGRTLASRSPLESLLWGLVFPLGNLLLPPLLHCGKTFCKLLVKRATGAAFADLSKPWMLAFCFCLNKLSQALAIFVTKLSRFEFSFQRSNKLFRHSQLFVLERAANRRREFIRGQDFFRISKLNHHQISVLDTHRPDISLAPHGPPRDAEHVAILQSFG